MLLYLSCLYTCKIYESFKVLEDVMKLLSFVTFFLVTIQDLNMTFDAPALNHLYNFKDDCSHPIRIV